MPITHSVVKVPGQKLFAVTDWNAIHTITSPLPVGTLLLASGSITDSSGAISFDNENLSTAGNITGNRFFAEDGDAGAPSYSFSSDTDSGFYTWEDGGGHQRITASIDGVRTFEVSQYSIFIKDSLSANLGEIQFAGTAMTANRPLYIDLNNSSRTLDLTGNATLNQDVSTQASPTFVGLNLSANLDMQDDDKILLGTGDDGQIMVSADNLYIVNITSNKDIIFGLNDGGVSKTITWDADVDKLKHSAGLFNFDNDNLLTTGILGIGTLSTASGINVVKTSSTITKAINATLIYTGSGFLSYGVNCINYQRTTNTVNPYTYGGIFDGRLSYASGSAIRDVSGTSVTHGGAFSARDTAATTYSRTGSGAYIFRAGVFQVVNAAGDWTTNNPPITTYNLYLYRTPTGYGTNHTHYSIYSAGGQVRFVDNTTGVTNLDIRKNIANANVPVALITQDSTTGAQPCLALDQDDISEGFIDFVGSNRGAIAGATNSTASVRVELGGVVYRLALYADA